MLLDDFAPINAGDKQPWEAVDIFQGKWQKNLWNFGAFQENKLVLADMESMVALVFNYASCNSDGGLALHAAIEILRLAGLGGEFEADYWKIKEAVMENPTQLFTQLPNDPSKVLQ